MPKKIRELFAARSKDYLIIAILFGYVLSLLLASLRTMVPMLKSEEPARLMVLSGQDFISNALFLPLRFLQYILIKLDLSYLDLRFPSIAFGLLTCVVLYQLLHKWHTRRVSFATVLLFASSSLFLATSRLATPDVMYILAIPSLLICGSWLRKKRDINKLPLSTLVASSLLYLPGVWLFIAVGGVALRRRIFAAWRLNTPLTQLATGLVALTVLTPLIYSFIRNPQQIITWLGLPELSSITPAAIGNNFLGIFDGLFWSGLDDKAFWLVGSPVLDIFAIATFVLGIYYYQFGYHPLRRRVLYGFGFLSIILITLGVVPLALILPLSYIFVAAGIALLLQQWFTVFPRNPLARAVALALISFVIIISCFYQLQRYFVAWPSSPETIEAIQSEKL